jgi:hypothetical protein
MLLASATEAALDQADSREPTDTPGLRGAMQMHGAVRIPTGTYELTGKLQTLVQNNISGDSRHDTILRPTGFPDYVLEVGDGRRNPNAGKIERLRFYGAAGNLGCLHMNSLSHMWHLDDLLFSGGPCPALVVDNCWDSNYTNIDILGHVTPGNDAARTSAVIFRNGTANIYCRGLRIEGALSGGIYSDAGPNYVVAGKIDDGFGGPQSAAAITIAAGGTLILEDFYLGGMLNQFHIEVAGSLRLGRVALDGGSNRPAAIHDRRAWTHVNAQTSPGWAAANFGPFIPTLDLGDAQFHRSHPSVDTVTAAAVYSRIHPVRQVRNLTLVSNGISRDGTRAVATNMQSTHADLYKDSYLVDNTTGARRKILASLVDGSLVLAGEAAAAPGTHWSIEFCETHATPVRHESVLLDPDQTLFAVLARSVHITGPLSYVATPADSAFGTTKFRIAAHSLAARQDLTGLFLVDESTAAGYYIEYGMDSEGFIGILYDRRSFIQVANGFSIVAGHVGTTKPAAASLARAEMAGGKLVPDLTIASAFEVSLSSAAALLIDDPSCTPPPTAGARVSFTLINTTAGALGEVVWGSAYKLSQWTNPAAGHSRSIELRFNGKNWVEIARTPADVPN